MVLPVGGFFPIPLAMMIPFMATQSLVMGEAFGKAFQFGKRKISAMSNDEFNKLNIEQVASEMFASYKNILPELKTSIADSADFQNHIFAQLILLGPNLIKALGGAVLTDIADTITPAGDTNEQGEVIKQPDITDTSTTTTTSHDDFAPTPTSGFLENFFVTLSLAINNGQKPTTSQVKQVVVSWWYAAKNNESLGNYINHVVKSISSTGSVSTGGKWYIKSTVEYKK